MKFESLNGYWLRNFKMSRYRDWTFRLANYTQEEEEAIKKIDCEYMVFGHEIAPTTGTPHLQGYIYFKNRKSLNQLKKMFGDRTHLENAKGNSQQNYEYCTKEGNFFEKGKRPLTAKEKRSKGGKTSAKMQKEDWANIISHAEKDDLEWIEQNFPRIFFVYKHNIERIRDGAKTEYNLDLDNKGLRDHFLWLWGPTGSGKSHSARTIAKKIDPDHEPYLKDWNKWWNGYKGQKVTIIDEASPERLEHLIDFLKKWADKWTFTAEVKGSSYNAIRPEYIIITSNYNMKDCIPRVQDYDALRRRFSVIEKYDKEQAIDWPPKDANEVEASDGGQEKNQAVAEEPRPVAARGNAGTLAATESKNSTQEAVSALLNLGEEVYDLEDPEDLERKRKRDEYLEQCKQANLKMRRIE